MPPPGERGSAKRAPESHGRSPAPPLRNRPGAPEGVSTRFWELLLAEPLERLTVLDVGTGEGRLALGLAPLARRVVGIDRDPGLVAEARHRATAAGLASAEFTVADADTVDYTEVLGGERPGLVASHLYLSEAMVERAARALEGGGILAFVGLHVDQWRETGRPSRFAYDAERVRALLGRSGFAVLFLQVERDVRRFDSVEAALAAAVGLEERWRADGRWFHYVRFLEAGGRTLTRSHLVVKARRS